MALNLHSLISFIFILLPTTPITHAKRNIFHENPSSPLNSIKELEGCHKGHNTKGIRHVKTYLKKFGYLENYPETLANTDHFDETLESAIKAFQENYHIKPTGTLDSQTISLITTPRCGVPDVVKGINHHHNPNPNPNSSGIHTVSHFTYFGDPQRWPPTKTHLTYKFIGDFPEMAVLPVQIAFEKWASVSRFTFSHAQFNGVSDITIGFYSGDHGDGIPFTSNIMAHAFYPKDGRMHFNVDKKWFYLFRTNDSYDLLSYSLHEIGHLLGLGHSSIREAIMFAYIDDGETKDLQDDDIQGIRALYNY